MTSQQLHSLTPSTSLPPSTRDNRPHLPSQTEQGQQQASRSDREVSLEDLTPKPRNLAAPRTPHRPRSSQHLRLWALLCAALLPGCSVLPDWTEPETRESRLRIQYAPAPTDRHVPMPSSTRDLTVLSLRPSRPGVRESYVEGKRHFLLPKSGRDTFVDCRLRLMRQRDATGAPLPWPSWKSIFPGAVRIVEDLPEHEASHKP